MFLYNQQTSESTSISDVHENRWENERKHDATPFVERSSVGRTIDQIGWIIFPENRYVKIWDATILTLLFLLAFVIPYQVGVSAGIYILINPWWLGMTVIIDGMFLIDTMLYFWRAFRDDSGRLVFDLRRIRRRYLRTFFLPNLLSNFPATVLFYVAVHRSSSGLGSFHADMANDSLFRDTDAGSDPTLIVIKLFDVLKFVRFARVRAIVKSSDVITDVVQNRDSRMLELFKFVSLLVVVSHWFACAWSFVAFVQVGSFDKDRLQSVPNWIGYWYEDNARDDGAGLNPLGWFRHADRYVLSLFWAIQTITSIGYGNISPLTLPEWWVACIMMLASGIMWAYVIGGLVGVVASMQVRGEAYRGRIDQANRMIRNFATGTNPPDFIDDVTIATADNVSRRRSTLSVGPFMSRVISTNFLDRMDATIEDSPIEGGALGRRIKKYIHNQMVMSDNTSCANSLGTVYPVFQTLSPELRRLSSYMVLRDDIEAVPYLSSRFLSIEEQSRVSLECAMLEFAAGEVVNIEESEAGMGRGIFVLKRGTAFGSRRDGKRRIGKSSLLTTGMSFGTEKVLVEDGKSAAGGYLHFLTFSKVVFIPRRVIVKILESNTNAWKNCARWKYSLAVLQLASGSDSGFERLHTDNE